MIETEDSRKIVSYFSGLSDEVYNVFMDFAVKKEYPKGEILIEHGKKNEFVFFLITGSAKSYNFKDSKLAYRPSGFWAWRVLHQVYN